MLTARVPAYIYIYIYISFHPYYTLFSAGHLDYIQVGQNWLFHVLGSIE